MNKLAWSGLALGIVGVAAAGIGGTACTVTSGTGDDGGITYTTPDSSTDTGTTGNDSGGGGEDGGADTGTTQDAALTCQTDAGTACDMCLGQSCCSQDVACQQDTNMTSTDGGQVPACVDYVNCVGADLVAGDGGISLSQAETDCSGGDAGGVYPQSSVQTGNALFSCAASSCASQCSM